MKARPIVLTRDQRALAEEYQALGHHVIFHPGGNLITVTTRPVRG